MSFANRFFFANCNTITCCTEKPYSDLKISFLLDLRFFCLSVLHRLRFVFSFYIQFSKYIARFLLLGGLKWIRTIDLALIRRAL